MSIGGSIGVTVANGSGLLLSKLHETVVDLLNNLRSTVRRRVLARLCLRLDLLLDPEIGLLESVIDGDRGFPAELLHNKLVIGVASSNAHGSLNVLDGKLLVLKRESNVGKLNHVHHLGGSKVDRYIAIGKSQTKDSLDTVVNEGKGTGLLSVAPHFKKFRGGDCLSAKGSGGLFTSSLPRTAGSVDVVESSNTDVDVEVTAVSECHLLGVELLEAVHVLRTCRPGIGLDKTGVFRIFLLGLVVDTGRGSVEEILDLVTTSGLEHVHGDGRVVEGKDRLVRDNKSHTSHVGGEVVHLSASFTGLTGDFKFTKIVKDEFITKLVILHELILLPVNDSDLVAIFFQTLGNVRADETSATADTDLLAISWRECKGSLFRHGARRDAVLW